ncbi:hypothetical protein BGZ47_010241 [Haplosporangium gracile]|nr:hypothetical protein BGZ47_010241 [Haplosporangium gracile]
MKFSVTATAVALLAIVASATPASNSTSKLTKRADCFSYTLTKYNTVSFGHDFSPNMDTVVSLPGIKLAYNTNNMELTITVKGKAYTHKKANAGGASSDYLFTDIHEYYGCMSALP